MFLAKPRNHVLFLLLLSPIYGLVAESNTPPLVFGLLPSRSPVTLMKHFSPLRKYLSQQLKHPIVLETAPNYSTFIGYTHNRKYDFVLTAPHFALLAIDSGKYNAPVTYTKSLMADILVRQNSPITHVQQLAGKKVSLPPESAIISMVGKYFLKKSGLSTKRAPQYIVSQSHNASIHAMLAGDTAAAIASANMTSQFMNKKAPIRKLASSDALPGMALLVARDLPKQLRVLFVHSLVQMTDKNEGQATLKEMNDSGYRNTRANEFEAARPYLDIYTESQKAKKD